MLMGGLGTLTGVALHSKRAQAADSTWQKIQDAATLRVGVIGGRPPYFWQVDGQWHGFSAKMGHDAAAALSKAMEQPIKVEFVNTSWATVVLDLQAGKVDVFFGMAQSPEREKALATFGPLYALPNVAINAAGFSPGDKWEDYNKPEVKVSAAMGTTDEEAARKLLPNATIRAMKSFAEAVMDVQSKNASTLITTVLTGLGAMKENPNLKQLVVLQPLYALPSGGGTRRDADRRFVDFMQQWAAAYRAEGTCQKVIFEAMAEYGLDTKALPPSIKF
jgi:polar amino acid transport system substrate-binding protein